MEFFFSYVFFALTIIIIWVTLTKVSDRIFELELIKEYALNSTGIFILKVAFDTKITDVNDAFIIHTNYEKKEICNLLSFSDFLSDKNDINYKVFTNTLYTKGNAFVETSIRTKDDKDLLVSLQAKVYKGKKGILSYVFVAKDITDVTNNLKIIDPTKSEMRILYMELAESENHMLRNFGNTNRENKTETNKSNDRHKFIVDSINIGMIDFDISNNVIFFSDKCRELFSLSPTSSHNDVKDQLLKLMYKEDYYKFLKSIYLVTTAKLETIKYSFRIYDNETVFKWIEFFGKISYDSKGKISYLTGSLNDITSNLIYQEKIKELAYFDKLTGLHNRTSMQEYMTTTLKKNQNVNSAFIFLDIDNFKYINDSFGHYFGDNILCEMSKRIKLISENYMVSRFSSDEIAIFIPHYSNMDTLVLYLKKLINTLSINYHDDDISYSVSASIGISLSPINGIDFENLLKYADIAMNHSKKTGKNKYTFFNEKMNLQFNERMLLEKDLRKALGDNIGLSLYLQPQYDIITSKLCGFESLARWIHGSRGNVLPTLFIPLAEETRLIIPLGKWMLLESCKVLKKLQDLGYNDIKISVNLSPIQLLDSDFIDIVQEILNFTQINPEKLELEITETVLMESFDSNIKKLNILKSMGISIALDDFGTGYSSLTYLKIIPMSSIKIDKSFIDNIATSDIDRKITKEIINLSHILKFKTIAEGVETKEQLDFIKSIGCDIVQGFLGGKPMVKDDIFLMLNKQLLDS